MNASTIEPFVKYKQYERFVQESNRIEGILDPPTNAEINEHIRFVKLETVALKDLLYFVGVYQPNADLRDSPTLNVRVGNYTPPPGGPEIKTRLERILELSNSAGKVLNPTDRSKLAYEIHIAFEMLHPFTDCNGRTGRVIWAWIMQDYPLGFLHKFYYQTLANSSAKT